MYKRHIIGTKGEKIAEKYLLEQKYQIIEKNFSCRQGEIDIIAKEKNEIVFIEVKTRSNRNYGSPIDAVTYFKKKNIIKSVQYYAYLKKIENEYIRLDIIEIYKNKDKFYIRHTKNAMMM